MHGAWSCFRLSATGRKWRTQVKKFVKNLAWSSVQKTVMSAVFAAAFAAHEAELLANWESLNSESGTFFKITV